MAAVSAAARVPTAARPPATRSRDIRPRRAPAARAPHRRGVIAASSDADDAMKDEASGAAMRAKESKEAGVDGKRPSRGGDPPPSEGGWEWTLNWDPIVLDENGVALANPSDAELHAASMIIGSCPRTAEDVDRLVDEAGVQAIICLQCALCHGALKIDWAPIKKRALERGVLIVRVSVRDFDRLDQAKMLPEMVRKLALFQAMGKKTYVHCTAGINRASLTVLGYLTFVRGMSYDDALRAVRECRPQANPYAVSWNIARARLLAERQEDVYLHTVVEQGGNSAEQGGDWIARDLQKAHVGVIQSIFQRAVESDMSLVDALANVAADPDPVEEK